MFWRRAFAQQPAYLGPIDLDLPTEVCKRVTPEDCCASTALSKHGTPSDRRFPFFQRARAIGGDLFLRDM